MKKISALYKTKPEFTWIEKWDDAEAGMRLQSPNDLAAVEEAFLFMQRSIVLEGDEPLPNIFISCKTESDRLAAFLAQPSPRARQAIDNARRSVSGGSFDEEGSTTIPTIPSNTPDSRVTDSNVVRDTNVSGGEDMEH